MSDRRYARLSGDATRDVGLLGRFGLIVRHLLEPLDAMRRSRNPTRYASWALPCRGRGRVTAKTVSASSERTSIAPLCAFAISFAM